MKIAVCEDNTIEMNEICKHIKSYCQSNNFIVDIDTYNNAESLLESYPSESYEIMFFDILMDGLTGIDAARRIREIDKDCTIVFITSSEDYSLDAYSVDGAAYILKPVSPSAIDKAMEKCRRQLMESGRFVIVDTDDAGIIRIPLAGIYYAEVYNKTVLIHTENNIVSTRKMTLRELEEEVGGEPFLRCHRSYLINMNHVETLSKGKFIMKNGDKVLFADRSYGAIQLAFGNFITKKLQEDI